MVIGWIYPHRKHCGIARYAHDYATALDRIADIRPVNPLWWYSDRRNLHSTINGCDIVHLQYDTPAYMRGRTDFFGALARSIPVPLVVSLHEIYEENPLVFPRSALTGNPLLRFCKQLRWDVQHPVDRAFHSHCMQHFYGRHLLVHHRYHRAILSSKGIDTAIISVLPLPIHQVSSPEPFAAKPSRPLQLGAHGFIQSAYDFDLLFATLQRLDSPWQFTWIGGVRTADQQHMFNELTSRIESYGWHDRFRITGWIDENTLGGYFEELDIVLALFRHRSSSASIARALGYGKPVIATSSPMTIELAEGNADSPRSNNAPLLIAPPDASRIADRITSFTTDKSLRRQLNEGIETYVDEHTFDRSACHLLHLYRRLLAR